MKLIETDEFSSRLPDIHPELDTGPRGTARRRIARCGTYAGKPALRHAFVFEAAADLYHSRHRAVLLDDALQEAAAKVEGEITIDRKVYGGAPCISGTRIPVYAILELIEAGWSAKKILSKKGFPTISADQLAAALRFATLLMER